MRKKTGIVLCLLLCIFLPSGCGKKTETSGGVAGSGNSAKQQIEEKQEQKNENADKSKESEEAAGAIEKEVVLPLSFYGIYDEKELNKQLKKEGVTQIKVNQEDGTVILDMSENTHQKLLSNQKKEIDGAIQKILEDKGTYPSYTAITYNDDVTGFQIIVNDGYESSQSFGSQQLFYEGTNYQLLNGVPEASINTTVDFVNEGSQQVVEHMDTASMNSEYNGN